MAQLKTLNQVENCKKGIKENLSRQSDSITLKQDSLNALKCQDALGTGSRRSKPNPSPRIKKKEKKKGFFTS